MEELNVRIQTDKRRFRNFPRIRKINLLLLTLLLASGAELHAQGNIKQTAEIYGQGLDGPLVENAVATLVRTPGGITIKVTMPTPMPGTYAYPGPNPFFPNPAEPGFPEVFSGWAFVFNEPAECAGFPCVPPSPANGFFAEGQPGVYNVAGRVASGDTLNLVGHIRIGDPVFEGSNPDSNIPLYNPEGAELHLAIAPHGALTPETMPTALRYPQGNPGYWWVSLFLPPEDN